MVRILIADDHDVVREGLRRIIETQPGWEIVAEAADGSAAIEQALKTRPDVAVIDCSLPLRTGIQVTAAIRSQAPDTEVLIFTMHDDETMLDELVRAGARGYLRKTDAARHLIAAIQALAAHKPFFAPDSPESLLQSVRKTEPSAPHLTEREREVVRFIAEGLSNKAIARSLGISLKTVETHRANILKKLNVSSIAAIVRYAVRNKIVEP